MPKRVIDFDAMWGSDKLASCAEWAQAEYAWLYGLADASGCFELTNLRVIWGRVAAVRRNLTIERLEQIFGEFQDKGLLFAWEHEGKRYGHWTGSDVPGRLPPPSWRMRLERLAPPVPKNALAEYVSRFARGRATLPGGGFATAGSGTTSRTAQGGFESSNLKSQSFGREFEGAAPRAGGTLRALKGDLEEGQAQDWNWDLDSDREVGRKGSRVGLGLNQKGPGSPQRSMPEKISPQQLNLPPPHSGNPKSKPSGDESPVTAPLVADTHATQAAAAGAGSGQTGFAPRDKSLLTARELAVGRGPSCGPVRVRPEVLERIRAREASRGGSRSP